MLLYLGLCVVEVDVEGILVEVGLLCCVLEEEVRHDVVGCYFDEGSCEEVE